MILFEDGTVLLLRRGHIRAEFDLTENKTDITLNKQTRFTIKQSGKSTEVVETSDADIWVSILLSIQKLHSPSSKKFEE